MVATVNNFWGAETGGLEEVRVVTGAVTASSGNVRSGAYSYLFNATTQAIELDIDIAVALGSDGYIFGFGFRGNTAGSIALQVTILDASLSGLVRGVVGINNNSTLRNAAGEIISTGLNLNSGQWYFIEVYFTTAGAWEWWIDGISQGSGTGTSFGATAPENIRFSGGTLTSETINVDDIYFMSGVSSAADRLGDPYVFAYRSSLASATPDSGSALNTGTWANAQEIPFSDTNTAVYTGTPLSGQVYTNDVGGSAGTGGPNTDANITGTILAHKGVYRALRGGGGGTTHSFLLGNSVDGVESFNQTLTTGAANYQKVSENATYLPATNEYGAIGFGVSGPQDFTMYDMLYQVLYVPAFGIIYNPAYRFTPFLVR